MLRLRENFHEKKHLLVTSRAPRRHQKVPTVSPEFIHQNGTNAAPILYQNSLPNGTKPLPKGYPWRHQTATKGYPKKPNHHQKGIPRVPNRHQKNTPRGTKPPPKGSKPPPKGYPKRHQTATNRVPQEASNRHHKGPNRHQKGTPKGTKPPPKGYPLRNQTRMPMISFI